VQVVEPEPNPFRCPECRSFNITYLHDAAVFYRQIQLTDGTIVREPGETNLYDNIIEPVCSECNFTAEHPDSSWE
jgi:hypothetical protein